MDRNGIVSLNLNIRGVGKSPTLEINEISRQLIKKGKNIYKLGLGQSPFPVPESVVEALKQHAHEKDYLPVNGLDELRRAVAHFHNVNDMVDIKPKNVLIGPGSKELMFILQLVFYGDILLPTPCWVSYVPQAKIIGRNVSLIHTGFDSKWRITGQLLEEFLKNENDKFKPRLMVLNYPSNPDGCSYTVDELKNIAKIARKYNIIILSDEIYGQIHHKGQHVSIARFYPEGTIISSGLSKWCGAGGWRLGTFAFPQHFEWLMNSMASVASETYTSVCAPVQYAAVKAFRGGQEIENYLSHVRRILSYISKKCVSILRAGGIKLHEPDGAFYIFPDFSDFRARLKERGIFTSKDLTRDLLQETGVALLPGANFQRPESELTARAAFVNFDGANALEASRSLGLDAELPEAFAEDCLSPVFEAMNRIADWANK